MQSYLTRESFFISRSLPRRSDRCVYSRRRCGGKCPPEITRLTAARLSDRTVGFTVFAEIWLIHSESFINNWCRDRRVIRIIHSPASPFSRLFPRLNCKCETISEYRNSLFVKWLARTWHNVRTMTAGTSLQINYALIVRFK